MINESSQETHHAFPDEILIEEKNNLEEEIPEKRVVALRPIWKLILALVIGAIVLCAIFNLIHTFNLLKHPKSTTKATCTSFATDMDTSWYKETLVAQNDQLNMKEKSLVKEKGELDSQHLNHSFSKESTPSNEEEQKAMAAPISSNQITGEVVDDKTVSEKREIEESEINVPADSLEKPTKVNSPVLFEKHGSSYTLQAGTIIPGILISGINSSLPGQVTAQVRSSVFDSMTGKHLLIPQGSKLVGNYESKICFGQKRLFLIWQRIILPSGDSIHLGGMPGSDLEGYSGFKDKVDNHYDTLLRSALLMSILSTGAQAGPVPQEKNQIGSDMLAKGVSLQLAETGSQLISKSMEVEPTLTIRPGYLFNITVTKDIIFSKPYSD